MVGGIVSIIVWWQGQYFQSHLTSRPWYLLTPYHEVVAGFDPRSYELWAEVRGPMPDVFSCTPARHHIITHTDPQPHLGYIHVTIELPEELRNRPLILDNIHVYQIGPWSLHHRNRWQPPDQDDGTNRWLRLDMRRPDACVTIRECHPCDVDGDGCVSGTDLAYVVAHLGDTGPWSIADVNRDHVVDGADVAEVIAAWGEGCRHPWPPPGAE